MGSYNIIPAVLASNWDELKKQIEKVSKLNETIHIDYADGKLVDGKTLDWQETLEVPKYFLDNLFEIHLMAEDPIPIACEAANNGFSKIIIQVEGLTENDVDKIERLCDQISIFLALKPQTKIEKLIPYLDVIEGVTIMTVEPGAQGRKFNQKPLEKIDQLKDQGFFGGIEIDGSVNLETIDAITQHRPDLLVVGSALLEAKNPQSVYEKFQERIA